ncbi:MAG: peptide deformylase [Sphaerochaetaceae bacterium]
MERTILLLGNPLLYQKSEECRKEELPQISLVKEDLRDTLLAFRRKYGVGRAIAAPQIGVRKRIIYRHLDTPILFLNPQIEYPEATMREVMDDCMSFPGLLVKVLRHKRCVLHYRDEQWKACDLEVEDDMAELLQHEYDHLDGILATMRAIDSKSFFIKAST